MGLFGGTNPVEGSAILPILTSDVTGLDAALTGKASTSHTHATSDVTGLDAALAGKASTSHTHATSDVTGLDAALTAKITAPGSLATGDIIYYNAGWLRLPVGTDGWVLTLASGVPSWAAAASGNEFLDGVFRIKNTASPTKVIAVSATSITAGQTRTITMPDRNVALDVITHNGTTTSGYTSGWIPYVASGVMWGATHFTYNNSNEQLILAGSTANEG